jgi:GNAT superfamily N-acetyltransferase
VDRVPPIRRATEDDLAALIDLHLATVLVAYRDWFPPGSPEPTPRQLSQVWSADLADAHGVLVCEDDDGALVGSVVARATGDLARLHVRPARWGEGIGGALHDAALDALWAGGHERAGLWVIEANERARGLYERRGWTLDPDREPLVELGVREVRYVRELV